MANFVKTAPKGIQDLFYQNNKNLKPSLYLNTLLKYEIRAGESERL